MGAAIAAGSQLMKVNWALFVIAAIIRSVAINRCEFDVQG